jgi:hypothetical protein
VVIINRYKGGQTYLQTKSSTVTTGLKAQSGIEQDVIWYLISAANPDSTAVVKYGEKLHIKTQSMYLTTTEKATRCPQNQYEVGGSTSKPTDPGTWTIQSATATDGEGVEFDGTQYIKNIQDTGSYLDTCDNVVGAAYCVSTAVSNNRDDRSGSWGFSAGTSNTVKN